jgi:hypothetical protein
MVDVDRPAPGGTMRHAAATLLIAACLLALAGCGWSNPDAQPTSEHTETTSSLQSPGEPVAPPPPTAATQAPRDVQRTPQAALQAFAGLYVNWTYKTLASNQLRLAGMSVGAARLSEQQAAVSSRGDTTIAAGHIWNSGEVISVAADLSRPGFWVLVTREQTGGDSEYEGVGAAYHVTIAKLAATTGGYAISQWLPQS